MGNQSWPLFQSGIRERSIGREKVFFVVVYRSPSQNAESLYSFLENLELIIQNLKDKNRIA